MHSHPVLVSWIAVLLATSLVRGHPRIRPLTFNLMATNTLNRYNGQLLRGILEPFTTRDPLIFGTGDSRYSVLNFTFDPFAGAIIFVEDSSHHELACNWRTNVGYNNTWHYFNPANIVAVPLESTTNYAPMDCKTYGGVLDCVVTTPGSFASPNRFDIFSDFQIRETPDGVAVLSIGSYLGHGSHSVTLKVIEPAV